MRLVLYLLSIIYGIISNLRNLLFDYNLLKAKEHKIPIICIGNLSIGGTGKTPHTNYIAKLLSKNYKVGILSRGYGRKSKEFNYVQANSPVYTVGDEPLQLKLNNPNCIVAVNNNRNKGVEKIIADFPDINIILLDDGFQHRKIKAGLNIIITPFYKPFMNNNLLPLGTLRESANAIRRANIIIISKSPSNLNPTEKKEISARLNLKADQQRYFSSIQYQKYKSIRDDKELESEQDYSITLVTGIANPEPLLKHLKEKAKNIHLIKFPDHHNYTLKDIEKILLIHRQDKSIKKLILSTEKDATKLRSFLSNFKQNNVYYIPIKILLNENKKFEKQLLDYAKKD